MEHACFLPFRPEPTRKAGDRQTINSGLAHLGTSAWLGGFSEAPDTKPLAELIPQPRAKTEAVLSLLR